MYPIREKTEVADSEKRTPEVEFRLFYSTFQKITFSQKSIFLTPLDRANARLKATIGGFHGPLTFFIESPSFFDNSFDMYPIGEKTEVADSEKGTPEVKF